ncbi:hypothetical protein MKW92_028664 [Papaver armeniacum]|nr:hypothetical protein MKW92_028664 [Papaver armeniacum]
MKMNQVWILETVMKLMIMLSVFVYATSATNYTVGGEYGWSLDSDMQAWSSNHTFYVGDTLVFLYKTIHNVLEVNEFAYNACITSSTMGIYDGGSVNITLKNTRTRYFICGGHCKEGLKVEIVVRAPTTPPNAPPTAAPSEATDISHKFKVTSVTCLVLIILMIIQW